MNVVVFLWKDQTCDEIGGGMFFQRATIEDFDNLFNWRNDPKTRRNSLNTGVVKRNEHQKWLKTVLVNPNREVYIAYLGSPPVAVGTVRLDKFEDDSMEISWTVAPFARGRGIGTQMLFLATMLTSLKLYARIKDDNIASLAMVKRVGFTKISPSVEGISLWELGPSS